MTAQIMIKCPVCGSPYVSEDKLLNRYTCLKCGHKFSEDEV